MNFDKLFGEVETKPIYFYLAKAALILNAIVLGAVLVTALNQVFLKQNSAAISYLISACQAISFIAVSVMGYHLSRRGGSKILKNAQATKSDIELPELSSEDSAA